MNCPHCKTVNDDENTFCVNCGATISANPPIYAGTSLQVGDSPSIQTRFPANAGFSPAIQDRRQPAPAVGPLTGTQPPESRRSWLKPLLLVFGVIFVLVLAGGLAGFYFYWFAPQAAESFPEHLGMFYRSGENAPLVELRRLEAANMLEGKEKLLKDESLPVVGEQPEIIYYGDVNEPPVAELKLVAVDSMKDDGSMKQLDFQTSLIEGRPAMKRLKVPQSLAVGKYAFVRTDGYFDDGKHRFWAFEIRNAEKKDNGTLAKDIVIALKPKPPVNNNTAKTPDGNVPTVTVSRPPVIQPAGSRKAYCNSGDVRIRSAPSLNAPVINKLRRGQVVFVLQYSGNTDNWRGTQANWAYIQTENGRSGWVFSPFISY